MYSSVKTHNKYTPYCGFESVVVVRTFLTKKEHTDVRLFSSSNTLHTVKEALFVYLNFFILNYYP